MVVKTVLHMNAGNGESSYANNSFVQEFMIRKAWPVMEETIKVMASNGGFSECLKIADLGCSSGPNTLLVVSKIIDTVHGLCQENNQKAPEFQVCLNDLPENDFNTVFKSLPTFYEKLKSEKGDNFGHCSIFGVPGSFYGRLFPRESMHIVHSSYSLHWLSQVPKGLENNKQNIYMAKTSPPNVFDAYFKQFKKDFSLFLSIRSEEIIQGGHMVLSLIGRSNADPTSNVDCYSWAPLAQSLVDMVAEGLVAEADIDSFNMPFYAPSKNEVRDIIQNEGSFSLDSLKFFEVNRDASDSAVDNSFVFDGKNMAKATRAAIEPMLASHFGNSIMDKVFQTYAKRVAEHMALEKTKDFNVVLSLTKK